MTTDYAARPFPRNTDNKHIVFYAEHDDNPEIYISSAKFLDGDEPANVDGKNYKFATAIAHPRYRAGKIVVVAVTDDEAELRELHNLWAAKILEEKFPDTIEDLCIFVSDKASAVKILASRTIAMMDGIPEELLDATETALGVKAGDRSYPTVIYLKTEPRDVSGVKKVRDELYKVLDMLEGDEPPSIPHEDAA